MQIPSSDYQQQHPRKQQQQLLQILHSQYEDESGISTRLPCTTVPNLRWKSSSTNNTLNTKSKMVTADVTNRPHNNISNDVVSAGASNSSCGGSHSGSATVRKGNLQSTKGLFHKGMSRLISPPSIVKASSLVVAPPLSPANSTSKHHNRRASDASSVTSLTMSEDTSLASSLRIIRITEASPKRPQQHQGTVLDSNDSNTSSTLSSLDAISGLYITEERRPTAVRNVEALRPVPFGRNISYNKDDPLFGSDDRVVSAVLDTDSENDNISSSDDERMTSSQDVGPVDLDSILDQEMLELECQKLAREQILLMYEQEHYQKSKSLIPPPLKKDCIIPPCRTLSTTASSSSSVSTTSSSSTAKKNRISIQRIDGTSTISSDKSVKSTSNSSGITKFRRMSMEGTISSASEPATSGCRSSNNSRSSRANNLESLLSKPSIDVCSQSSQSSSKSRYEKSLLHNDTNSTTLPINHKSNTTFSSPCFPRPLQHNFSLQPSFKSDDSMHSPNSNRDDNTRFRMSLSTPSTTTDVSIKKTSSRLPFPIRKRFQIDIQKPQMSRNMSTGSSSMQSTTMSSILDRSVISRNTLRTVGPIDVDSVSDLYGDDSSGSYTLDRDQSTYFGPNATTTMITIPPSSPSPPMDRFLTYLPCGDGDDDLCLPLDSGIVERVSPTQLGVTRARKFGQGGNIFSSTKSLASVLTDASAYSEAGDRSVVTEASEGPVDVDEFIPHNSYYLYDQHYIVLDETDISRGLVGYEVGFEPEMTTTIESFSEPQRLTNVWNVPTAISEVGDHGDTEEEVEDDDGVVQPRHSRSPMANKNMRDSIGLRFQSTVTDKEEDEEYDHKYRINKHESTCRTNMFSI